MGAFIIGLSTGCTIDYAQQIAYTKEVSKTAHINKSYIFILNEIRYSCIGNNLPRVCYIL